MFVPDATPDNRVETRFDLTRGGTALSVLMTLPDEATVRTMLQMGMTEGMEKTYDRLDTLLAQGARFTDAATSRPMARLVALP